MAKDKMYGLVADIGGTNARFALVALSGDTAPGLIEHVHKLACADYPSLPAAVRAYCELAGRDLLTIGAATMAVAGPVEGDWFEMTNNPWAFSIRAVQQELSFNSLTLINDFSAVAWTASRLGEADYAAIGGGKALLHAPAGIIGPGTGLGVGGLIPYAGGFVALQSEGGHAAFAPTNDLEIEILRVLQRKYERVSNERILSGPGLVDVYQALAKVENRQVEVRNAAAITEAAVTGSDALCVSTLSHFCAVLGSVAGDLALTLGAKAGVYIGGGIVPRFVDFLEQSPFRKRFEAKGRFSAYNAAIPTRVITVEYPGLMGAAACLLAHINANNVLENSV